MTMSRMAALLILASAAAPSPAQTVTAEEAMENYRNAFKSPVAQRCPSGGDSEDIVVCGRSGGDDRHRLPLPVARAPGTRVAGDVPRATLGRPETCSTVGPNQVCGGGLPIFAIAAAVAKAVVQVIEGKD